MHVHFLDPYHSRISPVHSLDARVKLMLTLAFILTAALMPNAAWPVYFLLFSFVLSVEILSGLGIGFIHKRALLAFPFIFSALPIIFTIQGKNLFSLPLGAWTITASREGLVRFIDIALKSWLSVQAAVVLASSTAFPDLLQAMRAIGIPRLLVMMFGLMWRYLFVLVDEAMRMMRARAARSGQSVQTGLKAGGSVIWRARITGGMAGSLFLRAFERSDRIYVAMLSRGYDGESRTLTLNALNSVSWLVSVFGLAVLSLLLITGFFFWG